MMNVKPWPLYLLCESGEIESCYMGRRRLVVVESLRKYAASLPTTAS